MTCHEAALLIHPYADGELDFTRTLEMENHLRDCQSCALAHQEIRKLRRSLKEPALRYAPPSGLERRLLTAVRHEAKEKPAPKAPAPKPSAATRPATTEERGRIVASGRR